VRCLTKLLHQELDKITCVKPLWFLGIKLAPAKTILITGGAGFNGSRGSDRSTFVDLLMGLLKPTTGKILVDGPDLYSMDYPKLLMA
jgi:ABC-type antimicrobial peptide transport system ATPase subunit